MSTSVWVDASAGVAGDMLAGALVDAGVPLDVMRAAVDAVMPAAVALECTRTLRAGMSASKFDVRVIESEAPHRHLANILSAVAHAPLAAQVQSMIEATFRCLGEAEAMAHGIAVQEVHFHEIGAADSIADVVSVCAGLHWLDARSIGFSTLELGYGDVRGGHGRIPVPTPAALRLTQGLNVKSEFAGEMATPTGLALLTALGEQTPPPSMRLLQSGAGAGSKDPADHANVVRVLVGDSTDPQLLIETNVDDMDPRLWPGAIEAILQAGARDAWLTPIVMKKGRPAHTLSVLCDGKARPEIEEAIFRSTSSIGLRVIEVDKVALDRGFAEVVVAGEPIAVKYAGRNDRIYNVSIEWDHIATAAQVSGMSERAVLAEATLAAKALGLVVGQPLP